MKAEEKMTWEELENYLAYRLAPVENGKGYWGESMEAIDEYVKAHANEALDGVAEFLLTHRVAWFSSAPHHRVILEAEPDAAMKTMAEAVRAFKE